MWIRIGICIALAWAMASGHELKLVKTIPVSELKNEKGAVPQVGENEVTFSPSSTDGVVHNAFGFVQNGARLVFYTGFNGMVADVETGQVSQTFPPDLAAVRISSSGEWVMGLRDHEHTLWSMHKGVVREQKAERWTWFMWLGWFHPSDSVFFAPDEATRYPYQPYGLKGVMVVDLATGKIRDRVPIEVSEVFPEEISQNGEWVLGGADPIDSIKVQKTQNGQRVYFDLPSNSGSDFVFNRDASWVAGDHHNTNIAFPEELRGVFLWDRVQKTYVWKGADLYTPSAFSPNNAFLLCGDQIVHSSTGKVAFKDLKGKRGKFSPDGRSLVTVDDEAFYIYTLPKESEPIFGVFQKPEPWSPPKAKTAAKPKGKTKKP